MRALDGPRWSELCAAADRLFGSDPAPGPSVGKAAAALIGTPAQAFHTGVARFRETHAVEDAHRLRILGKRVRYTAEFLKPLLSARARASIKRLSAFQDALGELQDAIAAGEFAGEQAKPRWSASPALQFVLGALAGAARIHAADARPRVDEALEALDPSALVTALQNELGGG
jgi:CHAD domain-containing protein